MLPEYLSTTTHITTLLRSSLSEKDYSSVSVIVDENTRKNCLPLIERSLPPSHQMIEIPSGEVNKNLSTCQQVWDALTRQLVDRNGLVINLGGGVVCDLGGFCASTYKRGIDFWHIPTTLLAQVDATLGGKLGVDYDHYKNHIGLFRMPEKVLVDPVFLQTLPAIELLSGKAEIIKHCLIADKEAFEDLVNNHLSLNPPLPVIERSLRIKESIVHEDQEETGPRKLLNFGHTVGHAMESYYLNSPAPLKHGIAVAAGMIIESYLSFAKEGLDKEDLSRIVSFINTHYRFNQINKKEYPSLIELMRHDKKNENRMIKSVLLRSIGSAHYDIIIAEQDIFDGFEFFNSQIK